MISLPACVLNIIFCLFIFINLFIESVLIDFWYLHISEFNEAYTAFSILTYDCLDPAEDAFNEGHQQFKKKVTELEQRLSLIVKNALQESQSPEAYFKVRELHWIE